MLLLAAITIFFTAGLLTYAAAMKADERLSVRAARIRLGDYESAPVKREEDLKESFAHRVVRPTGETVVELVKRFLPTEYVDKLRHKLVLAGRGSPEEFDRFLVVRVLSVVATWVR